MELPRPPRRACQRGSCSRGPASPIARADAVTARPRPGSSSPAMPSTCPSLGRAGACSGHELADSRGQQRYRAGSRDSALTSGEGSEQRRARGHAVHGMQGVRGSNPLSSTPGQRPNPDLAVSRSPGSGSRSAAIRAALADPVVQRGGNAGRRRRLETVISGRRRQPWPCNESPDRSGHGRPIQAGTAASS
jgi:hypothetical protein